MPHLFNVVTAFLAVSLLSAGRVDAQTPEAQKQIKVMTAAPSLTTAVPLTAIARQYDKAHGLTIENPQAGTNSSLIIDAVLSGNADFAVAGTLTVLQAIRAGGNLTIIGGVANNQLVTVLGTGASQKISVSNDAPIGERIKALKGLTIGTNPAGATYTQMLRAYLREYGLDPDNDVKLVGIADASALITGLEQGRFDAIATASGVAEQALALKAGTVWFSGARGDIPGAEKSIVALAVTRPDVIEKDAATVDAFRASLSDALKAINDDHEATGRILKDQYFQKFDPALWKIVWDGATAAFPTSLTFSQDAFRFWISNDPKGPESFQGIDYKKITYGPSQG
ncbi:ABC transporter substrate-binding protein [Rhizobium sp. CF142]|uniref:ABC transporter substrate-binding protein n=1 Tax=Rhizobium sp. CF142 TaxID=1144314 RepID=UPI00026EF442|nr:ABC transporter substrate-binding protein [Rhizobium sp. CF142]EJJ29488.1 ABC-type nitrate/sulfonate/bicarbonate transport system, periplasmic component [Rhizobium sp. CF142]